MEKSEKIRALEKKLAAGAQAGSAPTSVEKDGPTTAEFMAMKEINQKMSTGMKEMQQALMDTRREKNDIISKSEKELISIYVILYESYNLYVQKVLAARFYWNKKKS